MIEARTSAAQPVIETTTHPAVASRVASRIRLERPPVVLDVRQAGAGWWRLPAAAV